MKKRFFCVSLLAFLLISNYNFSQIKVQGVTLPAKLGKEDKVCVLNGAGVRNKYFMNVYIAGLYVTAKTTNPNEVINADKPMAVRLQIISALVTQDRMAESIVEGFQKSTKGNTKPIQKEIDIIVKIFKSEPIKVGDVFDIWYTPGIGITATKNSKKCDILIPGLQFKKYTFGIWLCEDPVDDILKDKMLGL
jgi:hypothetical protein